MPVRVPRCGAVLAVMVLALAGATGCSHERDIARISARESWTRSDSPGWIGHVQEDRSAIVALGATPANAPAVWRSTDGRRWEPAFVAPAEHGAIERLVRSKRGTVAIGYVQGDREREAVIWRGDDVSDLRLVHTVAGAMLSSLVATDDGFVAFGQRQSNERVALQSGDGRAWRPQESVFDVPPLALRDVAFSDGRFSAVGDSAGAAAFMATVWRSDDGVRWTVDYRSDDAGSAVALAAGGNRLHVGGFGDQRSVVWTRDGDEWVEAKLDRPHNGSVGLMAIVDDDRLLVLTIPGGGPPDAFGDSELYVVDGTNSWSVGRFHDLFGAESRMPSALAFVSGRLLLVVTTVDGQEIWSAKI
jgi:hypothetical protein